MNDTYLLSTILLNVLLILSIIWSGAKLIVKIGSMEENITSIKKTLGNGGYVGIKQDIQEMKERCAGEVADTQARLKALEKNQDK